jgi:5-methylcytosine-specific restriction protein A
LAAKEEGAMPATDDFRSEIQAQIARAVRQGRFHIEVNAGELHRSLGGYPPSGGKAHSIPACCNVMREEMRRGRAEIIHETGNGNAPSLTIRYYLPR